jgi:hypothetical protein
LPGKLKEQKMKKLLLTVLSVSLVSLGTHAQSDLFSTIQNWTGTGANEAGLVIDWYNGTTSEASLMWGYRWNGSANVEQMFDAVVASDPQLFAEVSEPGGEYGTAVYGIGYATTGDLPISLTPALSFNSQNLAYSAIGDDDRTANNAGDLWLEGWNDGYWALYTSTDSRLSVNESDWDSANYGITDQTLNNGDFAGLIFAPGFESPNPSDFEPAAPVPEPMTWALLGLGVLCFGSAGRKWSAHKNFRL